MHTTKRKNKKNGNIKSHVPLLPKKKIPLPDGKGINFLIHETMKRKN